MPAPSSYARRQFPGNATDTTISASINNSVTSCTLTATTGWPTGAYTGGVLCELYSTSTGATAEKVWATDLTGSTLTIVRAADGTSAASHAAGTGIRPIAGAIDADEANRAVNETIGQVTTAGDMLVADGAASMARLAVGASARIIVSNGTAPVWVAVSGDVTISSAGAVSIGNNKITNAMMADDAIDSAEIADGAIDLVHMSANSVDSDQYVDGSIDTAHIADAQITADKLAAAVAGDGLSGGAGTALAVGVDGSTIEINSDALRLKDDGVTLAKMAAAAKPRWSVAFGSLSDSDVGTATQFPRNDGVSGLIAFPYVAPEPGAIVGVSVACTDVRTAGTLTVEVYKNDVATGLTAVINGTDTQFAYGTQAETADAFAAGDRIDVRATSASFAGTLGWNVTADVLLQAV